MWISLENIKHKCRENVTNASILDVGNFPKGLYPSSNFPRVFSQVATSQVCLSRSPWPPWHVLVCGAFECLTFGKLLLGKLHIWKGATWEIVTWEVALEKMPLGFGKVPDNSLYIYIKIWNQDCFFFLAGINLSLGSWCNIWQKI